MLARWPGLPGAIHADAAGRLWVAASECLGCFRRGEYMNVRGEFGLIRHMDSRQGALLASDPVLDTLWEVRENRAEAILGGNVRHGIYV